MRGYGGTDAPLPVEGYGYQSILRDMSCLMDDVLGVRTAVLVGHDFGAIMAWFFAVHEPDRFPVLAVISVPPSGLGCWSSIDPIEGLRKQHGANYFYQLAHNEDQTYGEAWPFRPGVFSGPAEVEYDSDPARLLRMMFFTGRASSCKALQPWSKPTLTDRRRSAGGWFGRLPEATGFPDWLPEAEFHYYVDQFTASGFRGGVNYYRNNQRNWASTHHLADDTKVNQPLLFLAGEHDTVVHWSGGMAMIRERIHKLCVQVHAAVEIPDCGHWVMQEKPAEVNSALLGFLAIHAPAAAADAGTTSKPPQPPLSTGAEPKL